MITNKMSVINVNNPYSQSPSPTQNFTDPHASKISSTSKLYLGPPGSNLPGITNLFFAPCEFVKNVKAVGKANKIKDYQGIFENSLRAASAPMRFVNALGSAAWYVLEGGVFFKIIAESLQSSLAPLTLAVGVLGLVICAIEGILETWGLIKAKQFYTENYATGENLYFTKLQRLQQKYLQVSPQRLSEIEAYVREKFPDLTPEQQQEKKEAYIQAKLNRKFNNLARRVQPWLAEEIKQTVPGILQDYCTRPETLHFDSARQSQIEAKRPERGSHSKAMADEKDRFDKVAASRNSKFQAECSIPSSEKAADIFQKIKTQSMKKFLIHSVGLAAALITVVGLILSLAACPFFIPLIFVVLGGALALSRYFLNAGLIDSKDWRFNLQNCLPSIFKSKAAVPKKLEPVAVTFKLSFSPRADLMPRRKPNFRMA